MTEPKRHYTFDERLEKKLISVKSKWRQTLRKIWKIIYLKKSSTFAVKYCPFTEVSLERDHSMSTALGLDHCCWFLEDCSEGKHNFSISSCKPCRWIHSKMKTKEENQGYNRGRLQLFCSGVHQNKALSEEITLQRGTHHVSYSRETDMLNSDLLLAPSCCASYLWPEFWNFAFQLQSSKWCF